MKFHTDQMDEHKRKIDLRRMRQNARDQRATERHKARKAAAEAEAEAIINSFGAPA